MSDERRIGDFDNPEWTEADFSRARYGNDIPAEIRAAFGNKGDASLAASLARQGVGFSRAALAA